MVASVNGSTSGGSNWADSVFARLDTKKQGYIDKSDLASALSATGDSSATGDGSAVDDMFSAIDGDSDGKVTKSEFTDAMSKLSDQLNAQFDASRVQGGMAPGGAPGAPPDASASSSDASSVSASGSAGAAGGTPHAGGMRGAGGGGMGGAGGATDSTDSTTSTDYVAAADTDGDGTVSDAEQAAYDKKLASGEIDKNGNSTDSASGAGNTEPTREKDPMRELAHALHQLKAYADNGGGSDASAASTVSVEA